MLRALKNSLPAPVRSRVRSLRKKYDLVWRIKRASDDKKFNYLMTQHMRAVLSRRAIDLVIDVGANEGQFAKYLREQVGYKGRIISFEPVSTTYAQLEAAARFDPGWETIRAAAGASDGSLSINITRASVFNSFRMPSHNNVFSEWNKAVATEKVRVHRLDSFLSPEDASSSSIFLKADTQGFDLDVIRGAEGVLPRVQAIQTEISFIPIYEDTANYQETLGELSQAGFAVSNMFPVTLSDLQAVEFDCVLVRRRPPDAGPCLTYEQLVTETLNG